MNKEEKIRHIFDLFHKNVRNIVSVTTSTESEKSAFCLLVNGLSISALIEDRFIEENTKESIESFFEKYHIYHKIEGIKDQVLPIGDGILLWPNDENCQRLNRY